MMQIKNKLAVILSSMWLVFSSLVYYCSLPYLVTRISKLGSASDSQAVKLTHYAANYIAHHYLIALALYSVPFMVIMYYLLRAFIQKPYEKSLKAVHRQNEQYLLRIEKLNEELHYITQRVDKADKADEIFYKLNNLMNSVGTSLALLKEQENTQLVLEVIRVEKNIAEMKRVIQQFEGEVVG